MDVTMENFEAVLKDLESLIPASEFVAIDMEFTGLTGLNKSEYSNSSSSVSNDSDHMNHDGTEAGCLNGAKELEKKYDEVRTASNFLVIQVGVCPFSWNEKSSEFIAHPYNFYTFPREIRGHDPRFLCQTTSMIFLAERGHFDFNKLIKSGIPFLSHDQEALVRGASD